MPEGLDAVIERAVAKDPADRYPSAGALIAAARERQGAGLAATRVLSAARPTGRAGPRERATVPIGGRRAAVAQRRAAAAAARQAPAVGAAPGWRRSRRWSSSSSPCSAAAAASTSRRRSRSASAPLRVAAAADAIWVTSEPDGTLTRLDPETGEPRRRADPARRRHLRGRGRRRLGLGHRPAPRRAPAGRPGEPAGSLETIDGRRQPRRRSPSAAAASGSPTKTGAGITAVNAKSGRVFRRGLLPHAAPLRLAVGAGGLWVSSASTGSVRRIDLGTVRHRRRRSRSAAARPASPSPTAWSGSPTAARGTVSKVDPSIRAGARRPDRGRRPARRHRRRHQHRLGRQRRRGRGHPDRPRERRARSAPRSRSAPNRAPSPSARPRSGSPTTAKAPSPASNPEPTTAVEPRHVRPPRR